MKEIIFFIVLMGFPLVGIFLPRRIGEAFYGWLALLLGLAWLDGHVLSPLEDHDIFGLGGFLFASWLIAFGAGALVTLLKFTASSSRPMWQFEQQPFRSVFSCGSPILILLAAFFFHWLSNRLAGFSPSWLPHAVLITLSIGALLLLVWFRNHAAASYLPVIAIGAFSLTIATLTLNAALRGMEALADAQFFAGDLPFCAVTWIGNERARPAQNGFDLSPLVSRFRGRSPLDHSRDGWVVVERYGRVGIFSPGKSETAAAIAEQSWKGRYSSEFKLPCTPVQRGALS